MRSDWKRNACLSKPGSRGKGLARNKRKADDDDDDEEEEEEGEDGPSSVAPAKGGKVNGTRCLLRYSLAPCSSPVNESKLISTQCMTDIKGQTSNKYSNGRKEPKGRQRLQFKPVYIGIPSVILRAVHSLCIGFLSSTLSSSFLCSLNPSISYLLASPSRFHRDSFVSTRQRWIFGRICGRVSPIHSRGKTLLCFSCRDSLYSEANLEKI